MPVAEYDVRITNACQRIQLSARHLGQTEQRRCPANLAVLSALQMRGSRRSFLVFPKHCVLTPWSSQLLEYLWKR
jgi:hypothetical protein